MSAFAAMNASGVTFTGESASLKKQQAFEALALPNKDQAQELVKRLIKNVVEIKDTTGEQTQRTCYDGLSDFVHRLVS
jgi:hypothetical protein